MWCSKCDKSCLCCCSLQNVRLCDLMDCSDARLLCPPTVSQSLLKFRSGPHLFVPLYLEAAVMWMLHINIIVIFPFPLIASDTQRPALGTVLYRCSQWRAKVIGIIHKAISWVAHWINSIHRDLQCHTQ